jgi:hypothetical protein
MTAGLLSRILSNNSVPEDAKVISYTCSSFDEIKHTNYLDAVYYDEYNHLIIITSADDETEDALAKVNPSLLILYKEKSKKVEDLEKNN